MGVDTPAERSHGGAGSAGDDGRKNVRIRSAPDPDFILQAGALGALSAGAVADRTITVEQLITLFNRFRVAVHWIGEILRLNGYGRGKDQPKHPRAKQSTQAPRGESPSHQNGCQMPRPFPSRNPLPHIRTPS